jgi:hypothetical protein
MTDRAKKIGKKYNSQYNQYLKVIQGDNSNTNVIKPLKISKHKIYDNGETAVTKCENDEALNNDFSKTLVTDKQVVKNILDLSENHDKIIEVLKWFENGDKDKTNVIEIHEGIKIDLPDSENIDFRLTVRLNDVVWKQFSRFCVEHKEFNKKDLHSQALLDYINKYKDH